MQIDIALFELCALCKQLGRELGFERAQTVYVIRKKNEKLEITASVRKCHSRKPFALCIAEIPRRVHHWNIDRHAPADMERFRLRCLIRKWIRPWRFEIKRVCEDESGQFI